MELKTRIKAIDDFCGGVIDLGIKFKYRFKIMPNFVTKEMNFFYDSVTCTCLMAFLLQWFRIKGCFVNIPSDRPSLPRQRELNRRTSVC
jgi:hypothetical protein